MIESTVCVIGGGPAGSAAALRLRRLGHDVTLVERSRFPRSHVGESMGPGIWPLLDALDLREAVLATNPIAAPSSCVRWSEPFVEEHAAPVLLADRAALDAALLARARDAGVRVLEGTSIERRDVASPFVVDASGRAGWLRGRRRLLGRPTLALYAYWSWPYAFDEPRIEALDGGWLWGAPIPGAGVNVMAFVDPHAHPEYLDLLAQSTLFRTCLDGERLTPVRGADATAFASDEPMGRDFVRIGEAALALDPLANAGVQHAFTSAVHASIALHTMITIPERSEAAIEFYTSAQHAAAAQHATWTASYYTAADGVEGTFWTARAAEPDTAESRIGEEPDVPAPRDEHLLERSPDVVIRETPVIAGDLIELDRAVHHPRLPRPLRWLGGIDVLRLLNDVDRPLTAGQLQARWSRHADAQTAPRLVQWMLQRDLLRVGR